MARNLPIAILCAVAGVLFIPDVFAQDNEPPPPSSTEEVQDAIEANPGSQEVEYSEDNYRRFMELKDQTLQKSSLPTNKYQSGTQKLDELPESSQKHLRNQLREVILQEGAWTPGDEHKDYPYVPSEAAEDNAGLKQQEAEAWQELVGEYHEREAQIHANSARSDAAGAATQAGKLTDGSAEAQAGSGSPGGSGENDGANKGNHGAGEQGEQIGQEQQGDQARNEGGYSPGSAAQQGDPNAGSTAGVSENAMEFLMKNGGLETGKKAGLNGAPSGSKAQGEQTAQAGQENSTGQKAAADSNAMTTAASQAVQEETNSQSNAGSSQNAMEYLTGSENQDSNDATTSASPMDPDSEFDVVSKGTLSIKELSNAKGVTRPKQGNSPVTPPDEAKEKNQKDDGPR